MALFWMFCGGMALVTLTPRWVVQALADLLQGCGWNGEGNPFFAPGLSIWFPSGPWATVTSWRGI